MSSAFQWVNSLFQTLGKIFPRLVLIRTTYRGVLFQRDGSMKVIEPGLSWYWPVWSELRKIPITTRTWNTNLVVCQSEDTFLGINLVRVRKAFVQIRVTDVQLAVNLFELSNSVAGMAEMTLAETTTLEALKDTLDKKLRAFGISLESVAIVQDYTLIPVQNPPTGNSVPDWTKLDKDE